MEQVNVPDCRTVNEMSKRQSGSSKNTATDDPDLVRAAYWLWAAMESEYPGQWTKRLGDVMKANERLSLNARRWAAVSVKHQSEDVRDALIWLCTKRADSQFLPSLGQFRNACKDFKRRRQDRVAEVETRQALRLPVLEPDAETLREGMIARAEAFEVLGMDDRAMKIREQL